jgi:hypothetical protein
MNRLYVMVDSLDGEGATESRERAAIAQDDTQNTYVCQVFPDDKRIPVSVPCQGSANFSW